jgi:hypothetical protein
MRGELLNGNRFAASRRVLLSRTKRCAAKQRASSNGGEAGSVEPRTNEGETC